MNAHHHYVSSLRVAVVLTLMVSSCVESTPTPTSSGQGDVGSSTTSTVNSLSRNNSSQTTAPTPGPSTSLVAADSTVARTTLPVSQASCEGDDLGLSEENVTPGPVAVCLSKDDATTFMELAIVLPRAGVETAEQAFMALGNGIDPAESDRGFDSLIPTGWTEVLIVSRPAPDVIVVDLPDAIYAVNGLSTLANGDILLLQLFGTAFSDPTVAMVTITVNGERNGLCGFLQRRPGCDTSTRSNFFAGGPGF